MKDEQAAPELESDVAQLAEEELLEAFLSAQRPGFSRVDTWHRFQWGVRTADAKDEQGNTVETQTIIVLRDPITSSEVRIVMNQDLKAALVQALTHGIIQP